MLSASHGDVYVRLNCLRERLEGGEGRERALFEEARRKVSDQLLLLGGRAARPHLPLAARILSKKHEQCASAGLFLQNANATAVGVTGLGQFSFSTGALCTPSSSRLPIAAEHRRGGVGIRWTVMPPGILDPLYLVQEFFIHLVPVPRYRFHCTLIFTYLLLRFRAQLVLFFSADFLF